MRNRINEAYKQAMLNKEDNKKRVLNTLKAEIKNKEIELRSSQKEIVDADILSLIQKLIKQNNDAIEMFKQGGRNDLVEQNQKDNIILGEFLPKQLTNEEINDMLSSEIKKNEYSSMKDMGKVMAFVKANYSGQVDMGYVSKKIKELLST